MVLIQGLIAGILFGILLQRAEVAEMRQIKHAVAVYAQGRARRRRS